MPGRHKTPVQQAWDYARDIKGAPWVLVCNYVELRLYAVSETSLIYEEFKLNELTDHGTLKPGGIIKWKRGKQTELNFWYTSASAAEYQSGRSGLRLRRLSCRRV